MNRELLVIFGLLAGGFAVALIVFVVMWHVLDYVDHKYESGQWQEVPTAP